GVGWRAQGEGGALPAEAPGAAPLQVFEPEITLTTGKALRPGAKAPAVIENRVGKGRAIYLNLDVHGYGRDRLRPGAGAETLALFWNLLEGAGITAPVRVLGPDGAPVPCAEVWRYRGSGTEWVAVSRSPEFAADSLG